MPGARLVEKFRSFTPFTRAPWLECPALEKAPLYIAVPGMLGFRCKTTVPLCGSEMARGTRHRKCLPFSSVSSHLALVAAEFGLACRKLESELTDLTAMALNPCLAKACLNVSYVRPSRLRDGSSPLDLLDDETVLQGLSEVFLLVPRYIENSPRWLQSFPSRPPHPSNAHSSL